MIVSASINRLYMVFAKLKLRLKGYTNSNILYFSLKSIKINLCYFPKSSLILSERSHIYSTMWTRLFNFWNNLLTLQIFIIHKIRDQNTLFTGVRGRSTCSIHLQIKWSTLNGLKYMNINKSMLEDRPEITFTRRTQSYIDVVGIG